MRYSSGSRIRCNDYSNLAGAYFKKAMDEQTSGDQRDKLLQKAVANLRKSIKANPLNLHTYLLLGYTYYQLGQYSDAKEAFNQALMLDPNNIMVKGYINKIGLYH